LSGAKPGGDRLGGETPDFASLNPGYEAAPITRSRNFTICGGATRSRDPG